MSTTASRIREVLEQHVEVAGDDEPISLSSLELVMVTEGLEDAFGIRVRATEVVPEHFGTLSRLVAFVEGKQTA